MTDPILPRFKHGDIILVDGVRTTILSWPAENVGPFYWERPLPTGGVVNGNTYAELANIEETGETTTPTLETPVVTDPTADVEEPPAETVPDEEVTAAK